MRLRLGLALVAVSLTFSGTAVVRAQQTDSPLQGRVFQNSDGALYVYKDGAKYPVNLAPIDDDAINAIPDGHAIDRVDVLFQETPTVTPAPAPLPTPTPTRRFDLKTALISLSDMPAGWKAADPAGLKDLRTGGLAACKNVVPQANGVDERQLVGFAPATKPFIEAGGDIRQEVVRFFPGAANIYIDSLANTITGCLSYNAVTSAWDGPNLGDQTIRFVTCCVGRAYGGAGVMVRIGDVVSEVYTYDFARSPDLQLVEHAAERATALLQAAIK